MRRDELEQAIRAASEIVKAESVVVIGSQAILGSWTEEQLPVEATQSIEVDIAPIDDDDAGSLATLLDAAIGEWFRFHETFAFYVQGVSTTTAILPDGWQQQRLVRVSAPSTNGSTENSDRFGVRQRR